MKTLSGFWVKNSFFHLILFCLYVVVFLVYTYPLVHHFDDAFLGSGDAHISVFNVTHVKSFLEGKTDLFHTKIQLAPEGGSMIMHTSNWTMSFFASLFKNEELGINLFLMISYALSGVGAYVFAYRFLQNGIFSFLCGLIFSFSCYKMARLGCHYNLVLTACIPFLMIYWDKVRIITQDFRNWKPEKQLVKTFVVFFALFIFCFFSDFIVTITFLYFAFFYLIFDFLKNLYNAVKAKKWIKILGLVAVFVLLDQLALLFDVLDFNNKGAMTYSADLLSLYLPVTNQLFDYQAVTELQLSFTGGGEEVNIEFIVFLGFGLLFFVALSLFYFRRGRVTKELALLLFVTIMLFFSMMPNIKWAGSHLMYSPTAFMHYIPFVNHMRAPIRIVYIFQFMLSICTFYVLLNSSLSHFLSKAYVSLLIVVVFFLELWPRDYKFNFRNDQKGYYNYLSSKKYGNVLIYPFGVTGGIDGRGRFDLTELSKVRFHKKNLVGGHLSRINSKIFSQVDSNDFLTSLNEGVEFSLECAQDFRLLNIDYVVIDNKYLEENKVKFLISFLMTQNFYQVKLDDGIVCLSKNN